MFNFVQWHKVSYLNIPWAVWAIQLKMSLKLPYDLNYTSVNADESLSHGILKAICCNPSTSHERSCFVMHAKALKALWVACWLGDSPCVCVRLLAAKWRRGWHAVPYHGSVWNAIYRQFALLARSQFAAVLVQSFGVIVYSGSGALQMKYWSHGQFCN